MRLLDNLLPRSEERSAWPSTYGFQQFVDWFTFQSKQYGITGSSPLDPGDGFVSYIDSIHRRNPVVSAAAVSRALLISQLRFTWRNNQLSGTPGRQFGSSRLALLERPGAMKRTAFLHSMEMHASYAGTAYPVVKDGRLFLLRPDWVTVMLGTNSDPVGDLNLPPSDAEVVALVYQPEHAGRKGKPEAFLPGEFARWTPEPDPVYWWRGVSWVSSLVREIQIDGQVTQHQQKFFEHAATPNLVFIMDPAKTPDQVQAYADVVNEKHSGAMNKFKNMFLGGGTDVKVVGSDLDKLALKDVSGAFETRVSARSMVPAVILSIREGLGGSALNSGNYGQTRRQWADKWYTPTADSLCEALEDIVQPEPSAELTWDRRRVTFLQEDEKDAADIASTQAVAMRQLVEAGYDPGTVVAAVTTGDMTKLQHTGVFSVQLQPPGGADPTKPQAGGAPGVNEEASGMEDLLALTQAAQRIYLAVTNGVITPEEARRLLNRGGAELDIPGPFVGPAPA